jgi:MFS family permease
VGFLARPIGAAIFGHYGDRLGRKAALVVTLLIMGIATFLVALVPGYHSIGIWGAITLTAQRFIQGIGVGGEWGGSVLLAMEWAQSNQHRGFIASWPQFGVPAGLFLSNLAVLSMSAVSGEHFLELGWRVPFLFSIVLVVVGLYIRLGIQETPVFLRLVAERRIERAPVLEVLRRQPREIVLTALCRMAEQAPFYLFTAFVFAYGTDVLHLNRNFLLMAVLVAAMLSFITIPLFGYLSDRFGRKRIYMLGAALTGIYGFAYFKLLETKVPWVVVVAIVLSLIPHDIMYGPQAALIAESFTGRLRYSGASLGYQLSSLIAGGPAPLIASWLLGRYHSAGPIAIFIFVCAVTSLFATSLLKDHTNEDISTY